MDKFTFGMTMLLVGMGGTVLTLGFMSLIMVLLKKMFPIKNCEPPQDSKKEGAQC